MEKYQASFYRSSTNEFVFIGIVVAENIYEAKNKLSNLAELTNTTFYRISLLGKVKEGEEL